MRPLGLVLVAFVLMEPVTALVHRFVMHGVGERLHRSHHRPTTGRFEANDAFPVMFAALALAALWLGFHDPALADLVPLAIGVTAYGAAYALVHDAYIHRRIGWFGRRRSGTLERLADAHRIHHLYGGAPYGMLLPVVPRALRERAARTDRDPLRQRVASVPRA